MGCFFVTLTLLVILAALHTSHTTTEGAGELIENTVLEPGCYQPLCDQITIYSFGSAIESWETHLFVPTFDVRGKHMGMVNFS